jgi:hypothetical protein
LARQARCCFPKGREGQPGSQEGSPRCFHKAPRLLPLGDFSRPWKEKNCEPSPSHRASCPVAGPHLSKMPGCQGRSYTVRRYWVGLARASPSRPIRPSKLELRTRLSPELSP